MFKNKLANYETYSKGMNNSYDLETSLTCYEVYIELSRDKDGNPMKNRDGSDRYHPIDDLSISTLSQDKKVKEIREGFYKDIFEVNGDLVEKVEREEGKRVYYVVSEERVKTLPAGTKVVERNGTYRTLNEVGYALVDDRDIEHPRLVAVRKFKTEDHKAEAEQLVKPRQKVDQD